MDGTAAAPSRGRIAAPPSAARLPRRARRVVVLGLISVFSFTGLFEYLALVKG